MLNRLAEQDRAEAEAAATARPDSRPGGGVGGPADPAPQRESRRGRAARDYRKILAIVRADGPVQVRAVGEELGLQVTVRGKLEPLRAKMTKLADRGWLHKRGDGRFTARS
ncbi:hypothetical protein [Streptomyces sp. NBC_00076]|uniref:hypothetical protein n=1 Tax=Streptomyces sp. NBC_00076 TaxID=2975642 RepID=UPI00324CE966